MIELGKMNVLPITREVDFGLYLDGDEFGDILLPKRYIKPDFKIGDFIEVFLYLDSEDRLIATTEKPLAQVGDFELLKVAAVNRFGAFLDWGLPKELLVPFREQKQKLERGKSYLVHVYIDTRSNRIVASSKIERFLNKEPINYETGEQVNLIIYSQTDMGFNAIINHKHTGILYENEVFQKLRTGQKIKGYVKKVRDDQKIDLALQKPGYKAVDNIAKTILDQLEKNGGYLMISDKTSAEEINTLFGVSKKTFKKAIGALYKKRLITIDEQGIRLVG